MLVGQNQPEVVLHQHKGRDGGHDRPHRNQAFVFVDGNGLWIAHRGIPPSEGLSEVQAEFRPVHKWTAKGMGKLRVVAQRVNLCANCRSGFAVQPAGQHSRGQQCGAQEENPQAQLSSQAGQMLFFNEGVGNPPHQRPQNQKDHAELPPAPGNASACARPSAPASRPAKRAPRAVCDAPRHIPGWPDFRQGPKPGRGRRRFLRPAGNDWPHRWWSHCLLSPRVVALELGLDRRHAPVKS